MNVLALVSLSLATFAAPVDAKRKTTVNSVDEFWTFFIVIYSLVLLPVIGYFVYALLRDPAAPELARLTMQWVKERMFGFLGSHRDPSVHHKRVELERKQR